jgi:hypothetical protein
MVKCRDFGAQFKIVATNKIRGLRFFVLRDFSARNSAPGFSPPRPAMLHLPSILGSALANKNRGGGLVNVS